MQLEGSDRRVYHRMTVNGVGSPQPATVNDAGICIQRNPDCRYIAFHYSVNCSFLNRVVIGKSGKGTGWPLYIDGMLLTPYQYQRVDWVETVEGVSEEVSRLRVLKIIRYFSAINRKGKTTEGNSKYTVSHSQRQEINSPPTGSITKFCAAMKYVNPAFLACPNQTSIRTLGKLRKWSVAQKSRNVVYRHPEHRLILADAETCGTMNRLHDFVNRKDVHRTLNAIKDQSCAQLASYAQQFGDYSGPIRCIPGSGFGEASAALCRKASVAHFAAIAGISIGLDCTR
ncbi:uncharacterized protein BDR25DRAFT_357068 [Lindgomyces ingoldianus]|uniref:Uncharacterized protein n=1 Tax=Lindgomyces ingoldianus TaxID=673940 RepID=A0ACB6QNY0_9PLEO|nr:uncharacterized protein BDR25DRAFT_357068 [Lindgomyces ingoldianus]KAF2468703.1 hypothetical protein BDR25DRAFT_357068 [Lindgomyces ingoldianus]